MQFDKKGVETLLVNFTDNYEEMTSNVELKVKCWNIKTDWIIFLLFTTEE